MQDLAQCRQKINQIDRELIALLEKRLDQVSHIIAYKKAHQLPILDTSREQEILDKAASFVCNPDYQETILETFSDMIRHSKEYQAKQ